MERKFSDEFVNVINVRQCLENCIYELLNVLLCFCIVYGGISFFVYDKSFDFVPLKVLLCFLAVILVPRLKKSLSEGKYSFVEENISLKRLGSPFALLMTLYTAIIPTFIISSLGSDGDQVTFMIIGCLILALIFNFSNFQKAWVNEHKAIKDMDEIVIIHRLSSELDNIIRIVLLICAVMPSFDPICLALAFYFFRKTHRKDLLGDAQYISQFLDDEYHNERNKKEAEEKAACDEETAKYAPMLSSEAANVRSTLVPYFLWFHREGLSKYHYIAFFILAALSIYLFTTWSGVAVPTYASLVAIALVATNLVVAFLGSWAALKNDPKQILSASSSSIGLWRYIAVVMLLTIAVPAFYLYGGYLFDQNWQFPIEPVLVGLFIHYFACEAAWKHNGRLDKNITEDLKELDKKIYTRLFYPNVFIKLALVDCFVLAPFFTNCIYHIAAMLLIVLCDAYMPYKKALNGLVEEWKNSKN